MTDAGRPARVLMTADTIGGVWTYAVELARGLSREGVRVALATMGAPISEMQRCDARGIEALGIFESHHRLEWMPEPWEDVDRAGEWLLELERELRPDIIHLNGYAHGALPWKAPVVMVAHSCVCSWWHAVKGEPAPREWDEYRRRVGAGLRAASHVVAPTRAMLRALQDEHGVLPHTHVVPNARDAHAFRPGAKEELIFAAGRLGDEAKNIGLLGAASEGLPWPVYVAGRESDASGAAQVPANLTQLGHLPAHELSLWLARAAIYCLPAKYEPFGLSVLEAALSGCALVLGEIPSLRELWDGAALFVAPNDAAGLRRVLQQLMHHRVQRERLARRALDRALGFTPERQVAGYLNVYRAALAPAPEPEPPALSPA